MKKHIGYVSLLLALSSIARCLHAATAPEQINYQAKVEQNGVPFDGVGKFKFAIVDTAGTNTFWSNDGTSTNGVEPTAAVSLNVKGGILSVRLGDETYPNMTAIPASVFLNPDTWLRVWFGGTAGTTFEKLTPDSKLASVPYAMVAETVPDGSLSGHKFARESIWPVHAGRDNTIVSYYAEYTGTNLINVGVMPADKNYIITDIVFCWLAPASPAFSEVTPNVQVRYRVGETDTILFKGAYVQGPYGTASQGVTFAYTPPVSIAFRSGLVVPAGATLLIGGFNVETIPKGCSVAGFEIPVE